MMESSDNYDEDFGQELKTKSTRSPYEQDINIKSDEYNSNSVIKKEDSNNSLRSSTDSAAPQQSRLERETVTLLKEFPELPEPEKVIEIFTCTLNMGGSITDIISQTGSLYITEQYICYLNTTGTSKELIAFKDVKEVNREKSSGIELVTSQRRYLFTYFLSRELAYNILTTLVKSKENKNMNSANTLAATIKYAKENKSFHDQFSTISPHEVVLEHFSCSLQSNFQQGRMYITNYYNIYFYSSVPFYGEVKTVIPFSTIATIDRPLVTLGGTIDIECLDKKQYSFRGFVGTKEQCFSVLISTFEKFKNRPKMFGSPLATVINRENRASHIPLFVERCVAYLTASGLDSEGLFRLSGSKRDIEQIQYLIDEGIDVDLFAITDINMVAGLLKKFFRDLPESVFTFEFYNCFLSVNENKHLYDEQDYKRRLKELIHMLPLYNRKLAFYMIEFLHLVASHETSNKMNVRNLATIWGPLFLKSEDETIENQSVKTATDIMDVTLYLLANYKDLFD